MARQGEHTYRRRDGREREQKRNAGGDDRPEGEHEDEQRQRTERVPACFSCFENASLSALLELTEPAWPM